MVSFLTSQKKPFFQSRGWHVAFLILGALLIAGSIIFYQEYAEESRNKKEAALREATREEEQKEIKAWFEEQQRNNVMPETMPQAEKKEDDDDKKEEKVLPLLPPPPPASMARMKTAGCVADGFLSGYGGDINSSISLINRSQCYYLHRALETWLEPPDFELAREIQKKVTKPNTVYGMFIAEAIDTRAKYRYPTGDRDFDFDKMCREGSKDFWGEHSCKPSLQKAEYRKYLRYITEEAMNMGIQSFMFGQVFYQDSADLKKSVMPEVIKEMREYAAFRGMDILIGAQTNDITDEAYLRQFDFIEGGVGLRGDGSVEEGPCFSRWWKKPGDWCWALLWHPQFASKAQNVFLHLDWSGKVGDDMSVFTRMEEPTREQVLTSLYKRFTRDNKGFLLPVLATLHQDNDGCHGPKERFYSASKKYTCQDEDAINAIIEKAAKK